jgi:hypothetical protein
MVACIPEGAMLARHVNQNTEIGDDGPVAESFPQLQASERPAPVAILSPAKRTALLAFLDGDGTLHKSRGAWIAQPGILSGARIYGMTIADLAREGMLTLTVTRKDATARLTPRGKWFAQTLATEMRAHGGGEDTR